MRRGLVVIAAVLLSLVLAFNAQAAPSNVPQCSFYPISGFGTLWFTGWRVASQLGCPTSSEYGVGVSEQRFQYGQAIWFSDTNTVFVLSNSGSVQPYTGFSSIADLYNLYPWVRARLGWPTEDARWLTASWQDFQNGAMYWTHKSGRLVIYRGWFERH